MRTWVSAKLHGITVTDASVEYHGSVGIDAALMAAVDILPWEQVHVVNLSSGHRWVTYALPLEAGGGEFTLNGGGARLGVVGDVCVVMAYRTATEFTPAKVAFVGAGNTVVDSTVYRP